MYGTDENPCAHPQPQGRTRSEDLRENFPFFRFTKNRNSGKLKSMNTYEAIFLRKTTKNFLMEPVSAEVLSEIGTFYGEIPALFPGIETEIGITENTAAGKLINGIFSVQAPYYLSLYSEERDKCGMNAGYICEQISLFLLTKGLGSCVCGTRPLHGMVTSRGNKKLMVVMAFGKPKGALTRRHTEAKRLPLSELCVMKDQPHTWMKQVLETARLAPSQSNHQPWRFVVMGNRIHIFSKKQNAGRLKKWEEFDFGMMFAHIMIASEELWLDVDLIRLENISQKNFRSNQYVLSAIIKS